MLDTKRFAADLITHTKYAAHLPELSRRETFKEIVERGMQMHMDRFPSLTDDIRAAFKFVEDKKVLPSMRAMQFAGRAIETNNARIFNCSFVQMTSISSFKDTAFNLLSGSGVGYSVQRHHTDLLPLIRGVKTETRKYRISDSIEGWSDAIKYLIVSYAKGQERLLFDYSDIRPEGARLKTSGGRAPGHGKLKVALERIEGVLEQAVGRKMRPIEVHDIQCHIADCVAAGGIRRSAMIALFDLNDREMILCKTGNWWERNAQRGRANNSATVHLDFTTKEEFFDLWDLIRASGSGEPGLFFTRTFEMGGNPCFEISLMPNQFCNLTTINMATVTNQKDFLERAHVASLIGTLQASYTDFHYLSQEWKLQTEREALIGVSQTGIAENFPMWLQLDLKAGANQVLNSNERYAKLIGINRAARTTTGKPEGTGSMVLDMVASGIHDAHDRYFLRNVRFNKNEPIAQYLLACKYPYIEDDSINSDNIVVGIPIQASENAVTRDQTSAIQLLGRTRRSLTDWIHPGHRSGTNKNNQSVTVSIKEDEWDEVRDWMWDNRYTFTGISVLPHDGGTYQQAPFETIQEAEYISKLDGLKNFKFDPTDIYELEDNTSRQQEAACAGGACEVTF